MWQTELVRITRHLVDDLSTPYIFSDDRLEEAIIVAAQFVIDNVDLKETYTVDVDELTLTPDPTLNTKDIAFIALVCLKTACIVANSEYKTKSRTGGFLIKDGSSVVDTREHAKLFQNIAKDMCAQYEKSVWEFQLGKSTVGKAICGPMSSPDQNFGGTYSQEFH